MNELRQALEDELAAIEDLRQRKRLMRRATTLGLELLMTSLEVSAATFMPSGNEDNDTNSLLRRALSSLVERF